jgi:hypothetical protein
MPIKFGFREAEAMLAQARAMSDLLNAKSAEDRETALRAVVEANKLRRECSTGPRARRFA